MKEQKLKVGGGVVMWSVNASDRKKLESGFANIGLAGIMPRERTPKAVLNAALKMRYADSKTLVRPLAKKDAFTVVREQRGESQNDYNHQIAVHVSEDGVVSVPDATNEEWLIQQAYDQAAKVVPGSSVTHVLVGILKSTLFGIALKPSGGVYWLPERSLDAWAEIAQVVEDAAIEKDSSSVFLMRSVADLDAARTIRAGIIADIEAELAQINKDLDEGGLGERALQERAGRAKRLYKKLAEYEGLLGETLADVRTKIDAASTAAVEAVMLASAPTAY